MSNSELYQKVAAKKIEKEVLAEEVMQNPKLLPEVLAGFNEKKADIKYGCAKIVRIICEKKPELLYPHIDLFIDMLDSENNIFKWEGIHVIAGLAYVDKDNKIEQVFDKYFAPISGPVLITAGNIIGGAAKIALAKPHLTERITKEILKVEKAQYKTDECKNVAAGHAVNTFHQIFDQIEDKKPVVKFVEKQLSNTRDAVKKKAEKFMRKFDS